MEVVRLDDSRPAQGSDVPAGAFQRHPAGGWLVPADAGDGLARAFQRDPAWVWLIPDDAKRRELLPWLFRVGFDVTAAEVWTTDGVVRGASRWLPPGRPPMRVGPTLRALATTPFKLGKSMAP